MDDSEIYTRMADHELIQDKFHSQQHKKAYGGLLPSYVYDRTMDRVGILVWVPSLLKKHLGLKGDYLIISVEHNREAGDKTPPESIEDTCIWLPRQDQLQGMISSDVHYLMNRFATRLLELGNYTEQFKTMEQLWLAFVMNELHDLTWHNEQGWEMEEIATCKSCKTQAWYIYRTRMVCVGCGKEYTWPTDCSDAEATKAQDIVHLINDNY